MTDKQIAEKLIRWFISIKYYAYPKVQAREYACNDLKQLKDLYGWEPMRKAFSHSACTSIQQFKILCTNFVKQLK